MKDINGNQIQIDWDNPVACKGGFETRPYGGDFTNEEMQILRLLQRGKQNAIKEKMLVFATGLHGVEVREKIRHLIMEHSVLIASCTRGFFIAETLDEIQAATKSLRHRGIMILMRAAKLQKISLEEIFHQARLEFTGGENNG